jgi:hypothetical protein
VAYYESEQLFGALSEARERTANVAAELRPGVEELLTVALLAGNGVPDRLDHLTDVMVDCAPDVRPVVSSLIASLSARSRDEQRRVIAMARSLLDGTATKNAAEADAFADFSWETFRE